MLARVALAGGEEEPALVSRKNRTVHFPIARSERRRLSAFERNCIEVRVAGALGLEIKIPIRFHPTQCEPARPIHPRVVMIVFDDARFAGGFIQRQNPAILVIGCPSQQRGLGTVFRPDRLRQLDVAFLSTGFASDLASSGAGGNFCP